MIEALQVEAGISESSTVNRCVGIVSGTLLYDSADVLTNSSIYDS